MRKPEAVLPADKQVLMAFMSQLILCQYATGTIGKFLSCIVTKHRQFGYPSPLQHREMGAWLLGLKKNTSSGVKTKMRLTPIHIRLIASLPTTSLLHERDSIMVQLGTLGAFRQSELISLDVCDWLTNRECDSRGQSYGAMVFLKKQKNDQEGKGRWKRIGWGGDLCLVRRVERYLHEAQLYTHADCQKWKDVAMRTMPCAKCGPLFPMVYGGTRFNNKRERINAKHITNAIARMLTAAHVDDAGFTSKSMRKGGLSTAKRAGVPKALRCQQSGHQSNAHKVYESDDDTDTEGNQDLPKNEPPGGFRKEHLYRFSQMFGL
jgi:integrase